jgi:hypothetical protein
MATVADLTTALAAVDADTTALGVVVTSVIPLIGVGMTQAAVDAATATLQSVATRLTGMASSLTQPVPPGPAPTPVPAQAKKP